MKPNPFLAAEEEWLVSSINTTPLVDVMLVLLIIFLITIPVVRQSVPVALPQEVSQPTTMRPETITIAIDAEGALFFNDRPLASIAELVTRLAERAGEEPQPEVQIRADRGLRYEQVGRVVAACQRASLARIAFIVQPDRAVP